MKNSFKERFKDVVNSVMLVKKEEVKSYEKFNPCDISQDEEELIEKERVKKFTEIISKTSDSESLNTIQMPKYKCIKEVWALKIESIEFDSDIARKQDNRETDGSAVITPEDTRYAPFRVDRDYVTKHNPIAGGYYVVYKGGYKSFSPADAFEEGYILL